MFSIMHYFSFDLFFSQIQVNSKEENVKNEHQSESTHTAVYEVGNEDDIEGTTIRKENLIDEDRSIMTMNNEECVVIQYENDRV